MTNGARAVFWIEILPLALAVIAFIFLVRYRAEIAAATIASPIPPLP